MVPVGNGLGPSDNEPLPKLVLKLCRHIALLGRNELSNHHNVNGDLIKLFFP